MCLLENENGNRSMVRRRWTLVEMAILLVTVSAAGQVLHLRPGRGADMIDFARGLVLGIAVGVSLFTLVLCSRRPRNNG